MTIRVAFLLSLSSMLLAHQPPLPPPPDYVVHPEIEVSALVRNLESYKLEMETYGIRFGEPEYCDPLPRNAPVLTTRRQVQIVEAYLRLPYWLRIAPKGCITWEEEASWPAALGTDFWPVIHMLMLFTDKAFDYRSSLLHIYVAHETAHALQHLVLDRKLWDEWQAISGWEWEWVVEGESGNFRHDEEAGFITDYSRTNPGEDFAESVETYAVFGPGEIPWYTEESLEECCPEKLDFIEEKVLPRLANWREALK